MQIPATTTRWPPAVQISGPFQAVPTFFNFVASDPLITEQSAPVSKRAVTLWLLIRALRSLVRLVASRLGHGIGSRLRRFVTLFPSCVIKFFWGFEILTSGPCPDVKFHCGVVITGREYSVFRCTATESVVVLCFPDLGWATSPRMGWFWRTASGEVTCSPE